MKNNIFAYFFVIFVLAMYLSLSVLISTICYPIKYFDDVTKCCQSYNIEYSLALAVIKAESNFKKEKFQDIVSKREEEAIKILTEDIMNMERIYKEFCLTNDALI